MQINYAFASDLQELVERIIRTLEWNHLLGKVVCVRAERSKARWTVARVHALSRVFQAVLKTGPCYVIEVIPKAFDKLSQEEKIETLVHELLHIPKACGGGLRSHRFVTGRRVKKLSKKVSRALNGM